jgi:1-deoxy-D-xylulose-5-phosphate synthase
MRFIKPIDEELLIDICKRFNKIITLEENSTIGGFGSAVLEAIHYNRIKNVQVYLKGLPDKFIEHGTIDELYKVVGLDIQSLKEYVKEVVNTVI